MGLLTCEMTCVFFILFMGAWILVCSYVYHLGKRRVRRDVARAIRDVTKERGYAWGKLPPPKKG